MNDYHLVGLECLEDDPNDTLSVGAIVGIVLGALGVIGLIIGGIFLLKRCKKVESGVMSKPQKDAVQNT